MLDLKNIYNEIIDGIKNMTDEEMIDEMVNEGCIYLGRTNEFNLALKYSLTASISELLVNINDNDYSDFKGDIAA